MKTYFDCWAEVAAALFSQALAGEPELSESLPKPLAGEAFGWAATLAGEVTGRFAILLDGSVLETPLVGEGVDQKAGWKELVRETFDAAAGELLARTGKKCQVANCEEIAAESQVSRAFQLRSGDRAWTVLVRDELRAAEAQAQAQAAAPPASRAEDRDARAAAAPLTPLPGLTPASNCCSTSNSKPRCALARARCRWARFSIWGRAMWLNWIAMWPTRWT